MSLQPNIGVNGAQVPDRARQYPSQSLSASHCLPLSLVSLTQVSPLDLPTLLHCPPCFTQTLSASDITRGGAAGAVAIGGTSSGVRPGFAGGGPGGETAASGFCPGFVGFGFGRGTPFCAGDAVSSVVTVIAPAVMGLSALTLGLAAIPGTASVQAARISRVISGKRRIWIRSIIRRQGLIWGLGARPKSLIRLRVAAMHGVNLGQNLV